MMRSQQASKGDVLIVEDTPASLKLLSDLLTEAGYHVRQAPNGELALWSAQSRPPELILLDVRMPGIDGFEVCRRLKASPELRQVPVIFLSAQHDTDDKVRGFALGGVDFIAKPFQAEEILARTDAHVRLGRARQALAAERQSLERRVAERTAELASLAASLAAEVERCRANEDALRLAITERKAEQHLIDFLSYYDALTGLPNRQQARQGFDEALAAARRNGHSVAVLCLDLDRFKSVNDSYGPPLADQALRAVARFLRGCVREGDMVSRQGGDEFLIIVPDDAQCSATMAIADAILGGLRAGLKIEGQSIALTTSIGIAVSPSDGDMLDELLRHADTALYRAKELGRDSYAFFTERMDADIRSKLAMQAQLRGAIMHPERGEFAVHYQPQVCLRTGAMLGAEALLRWDNPVLGKVPPNRFIPLAEEYGLTNAIGVWVLDTVCAQIRQWRDQGLGQVKVAVNLSGSQFAHDSTVPTVEGLLRRHGIAAASLGLEITEGTVMGDPDKAVQALRRLKDIGVAISLDDFGTGYSSLAYLKRFPIDVLKIDKSFVDDVTAKASDAAIALSVISLAHNLNMRVIAEGVETREQVHFLAAHGCDEMQGYYYSRPLEAAAFTTLLRHKRPLQLSDT